MESRKESLSTLKVCRFCLATDETLIPLYDNKIRAPKNSVPFALKILACIAIEIFPSDNMPQYICQRCKLFMELSYAFKQLCRQTDEAILQFIQHGAPLAPMPWPTQLNKTFKAVNKPEVNIVKTVVQGGATVKVMAEEVTDSEEGDDDNVYNVKIGDGSEDGKSIKIITSIDKNEQSRSKKGRQGISKNLEEPETLGVAVVETGCWACNECECTYPLEQLLVLHTAQKHRVRNEICDQCNTKFFSKHDLEMHLLTHSSKMPFQCVCCDKKFKRLIQLRRHEKIMHADLPQQSCVHCPATFLSLEELDAHQHKHDPVTTRPYICYICNKRFHDKTILQRHTILVHGKKSAFSCQYCTEQFPSVSKLTRHVREHAGVRPYPCKHCDKSFTKSHHYTRHLRLKHNSVRTAGPYTAADAYRCDECEDTFGTQDELMYHSALHATRNLICPLCQEKFDDVDTVTAHIKSHVNGTEFMCDFCELIFTSKEKLENHIARSHDDELLVNDQETENDESSMDMDAEEEDDDNSINVKEVDGHMVVEIKKAGEYMLPTTSGGETDKADVNQSEDSEAYVDSPATEIETVTTLKRQDVMAAGVTITKLQELVPEQQLTAVLKTEPLDTHPAHILRKAEEIKRKAVVAPDKKEKAANKVESSSAATGASNKSLRLLEKELQDLKRTNTRAEVVKTPTRVVETQRNRRPQLYSSTPKIRNMDKKETGSARSTPDKQAQVERKQPERKVSKEPKEKEVKSNNNHIKDDKDLKGNGKDDKEVAKEEKKETPKASAKNGADTSATEETVRRSTRPSKIKDYAKMIRDNTINSDDNDTDFEEEYLEEYKEQDKSHETSRVRGRRASIKQTTPVLGKVAAPNTLPRKRGRPRKEPLSAVPSKIKKDEPSEEEADTDLSKEDPSKVDPTKVNPPKANTPVPRLSPQTEDVSQNIEPENVNITEGIKTPEGNKLQSELKPGVIISPSGQTLKKVPVRSLPPGVKPLPLPVNSRLGGAEVCEMQIGKKMVKVQKIVMTKAEVEAMAKKGLVEMKDGTMVLKQGIKLPAADPAALKSTLVGDKELKKESPQKFEKAAPTRCNLDA